MGKPAIGGQLVGINLLSLFLGKLVAGHILPISFGIVLH